MRLENNHIDQLFRKGLENLQKDPPAQILDRVIVQVAFLRRIKYWARVRMTIGVAASLALAILAGWYGLQRNDNLLSNLSTVKPAIEAPVYQTQPERVVQKQTTVNEIPAILASASSKQNSVSSQKTKKKILVSSIEKPSPGRVENSIASSIVKDEKTDEQIQSENNQSRASKDSAANKTVIKYPSSTFNSNTYAANKVTATKRKEFNLGTWLQKAEASPIITSLLSVVSKAQEHLSLRAEFSPIITSQHSAVAILTSVDPTSKSLNTYGGGMVASYQVTKRFSVKSGLIYSKFKQSTQLNSGMGESSSFSYFEPVDKNGTISSDVRMNRSTPIKKALAIINNQVVSLFGSDISQELDYLEMPISASYKLLDKKVTFGLTGGVSSNFLVGNSASIFENGMKLGEGETFNLRNVVFSGTAGLELGYNISKNLQLTVEPRVKQYLHSISSNDLVDFKPLQLGVFTGISYSFH